MSALHRTGPDEYEMWDESRRGSVRVAIIRKVSIGVPSQPYWRSVTGDEDRSKRRLLGYFPTLEFAAHVTWRLWDQHGRIPIEDQYV